MGNTCCDDRRTSSSSSHSKSKAQRPSVPPKATEQANTAQSYVPKPKALTLEAVRALEGEFLDYFQATKQISTSLKYELLQTVEKATGLPCLVRELPKILSAKASVGLGKEALMWQKLDHPNILRLIDLVQDWKSLYLIFENYVGQDFQRYIQTRTVFSEAEVAEIMIQVFRVISTGHKQGVIYRNLQPGNFLIGSMTASTALVIKLVNIEDACFGSAKHQYLLQRKLSDFVAPEIRARTSYSSTCDMWSAGMIMLRLLSGSTSSNPMSLLTVLRDRKGVSIEAFGLMRQLLLENPESRPLVTDCLNLPWLSGHMHTGQLSTSLKDIVATAKHQKPPEGLKRAVLLFICTRVIDPRSLSRAQEIFQALDTNGDGRLTKAELLKGIAQVSSQSKSDAESVLKLLDADHNGSIEYTEFLMIAFSDSKTLTDKTLRLAFQSLDKDDNGSISVAELKEVLRFKEASDEAWESYMSALDRTGDGTIDYEEFKAWVTQVTYR